MFEGPSLEDQIAAARQRLDAARGTDWSGGIFGNRTNPDSLYGSMYAEELAAYRALVEDKRRIDMAQRERQRQERERAAGTAAWAIAGRSPALQSRLEEERLRNEIVALQAGTMAPGLDATQRADIATVIEAKTGALTALASAQQRNAELDRLDIQIQNERNPLLRADLEARRTRLQMLGQEVSGSAVVAASDRARNRVILEATEGAQAHAQAMQDEARIQADLNAGIASGHLTVNEANRLLQEELALRPLVAASVAAEGAEKARLLEVIGRLREGYASMAQAQRGQSLAEHVRSQDEQLARLRLELTLVGATAAQRSRALALHDAEARARQLGYQGDSTEARQLKAKAAGLADVTAELERQRGAWEKVHRAAEGVIDGPIDALLKGDLKGALASFGEEMLGLYAELAWKNPLKNRMLGTNYATLDDVGGMGGMIGGLFAGGTKGNAGGSHDFAHVASVHGSHHADGEYFDVRPVRIAAGGGTCPGGERSLGAYRPQHRGGPTPLSRGGRGAAGRCANGVERAIRGSAFCNGGRGAGNLWSSRCQDWLRVSHGRTSGGDLRAGGAEAWQRGGGPEVGGRTRQVEP